MRKQLQEIKVLLHSVPSLTFTLFVVSVIAMNLLANKTIIQTEWLALDAGILISWLSFMCMDVLTIHFGPKAATWLAIVALVINLFVCLIFRIATIIPSSANDYSSFDTIFGSTWFILFSSSVAFIISALINNFLNWMIGKGLNENKTKKAYMVRTYISTFIGQFVDNLVFATLVFMVFAPLYWDGFSWTLIQCIGCALSGAVLELVMEVIFSPFGYKITRHWAKEGVGQEYLNFKGRDI